MNSAVKFTYWEKQDYEFLKVGEIGLNNRGGMTLMLAQMDSYIIKDINASKQCIL